MGYKAFTLVPNYCFTDEDSTKMPPLPKPEDSDNTPLKCVKLLGTATPQGAVLGTFERETFCRTDSRDKSCNY